MKFWSQIVHKYGNPGMPGGFGRFATSDTLGGISWESHENTARHVLGTVVPHDALAGLTDTDIISPVAGNLLVYNGLVWVAGTSSDIGSIWEVEWTPYSLNPAGGHYETLDRSTFRKLSITGTITQLDGISPVNDAEAIIICNRSGHTIYLAQDVTNSPYSFAQPFNLGNGTWTILIYSSADNYWLPLQSLPPP